MKAIWLENKKLSIRDDLPIPVATVRRSVLDRLHELARRAGAARLQLSGRDANTSAEYVLARKPGVGAAIVISTPLTGWFRCGAERGPGVALMLGLARALARSSRPVWMVATGAHEIGHLGMKRALASGRLPPPCDTALWLHLGAGICARALDGRYSIKIPQNIMLTASLAGRLGSDFAAPEWTYVEARPNGPGEGGDVIAAGYERLIGLSAPFPGFHTPGDDGGAVDYQKLARLEHDLGAVITRVLST